MKKNELAMKVLNHPSVLNSTYITDRLTILSTHVLGYFLLNAVEGKRVAYLTDIQRQIDIDTGATVTLESIYVLANVLNHMELKVQMHSPLDSREQEVLDGVLRDHVLDITQTDVVLPGSHTIHESDGRVDEGIFQVDSNWLLVQVLQDIMPFDIPQPTENGDLEDLLRQRLEEMK